MPEATKPKRCPICGKSSVPAFDPFCSARCQDVDLNRWLSGTYRIPTDEQPKSESDKSDDDQA